VGFGGIRRLEGQHTAYVYVRTAFSVSASGSSLNMPGNNTQRADQVKVPWIFWGGIGSSSSYFDPLAFKPVTTARFGNAGFNALRGPGVANMDMGIFREFAVKERLKIQFRGRLSTLPIRLILRCRALTASNVGFEPGRYGQEPCRVYDDYWNAEPGPGLRRAAHPFRTSAELLKRFIAVDERRSLASCGPVEQPLGVAPVQAVEYRGR